MPDQTVAAAIERAPRIQEEKGRAIPRRANRLIAALLIITFLDTVAQIVAQGIVSNEDVLKMVAGEFNAVGIVILVYGAFVLATVVLIAVLLIFDHQGKVQHARYLTRSLIVTLIGSLLLCVLVNGIIWIELTYLIQFVCVIAYQVYNDPCLDRAPKFTRIKDGHAARERARAGKDDGTGFIPLNFFNLFWVFVVACFCGLCVEMVFCLVVNNVWESRVGLLWGPFSPIYGFGAVLMTIALNRLWAKNAALSFVIAGAIGAGFEFFVSWYMQTALGVTAWDYSDSFLNIQGRTDLAHFLAWGFLGLAWMRLLLPEILRLIDGIKVSWRATFTVLATAFMVTNGVMTALALGCWSERQAGLPVETSVQQFYAKAFPDDFMQRRFATMTMHQDLAQEAQSSVIRNSGK